MIFVDTEPNSSELSDDAGSISDNSLTSVSPTNCQSNTNLPNILNGKNVTTSAVEVQNGKLVSIGGVDYDVESI